MKELADKFFKNKYYAVDDDLIFIDGGITIDTIISAAEWITLNGTDMQKHQ